MIPGLKSEGTHLISPISTILYCTTSGSSFDIRKDTCRQAKQVIPSIVRGTDQLTAGLIITDDMMYCSDGASNPSPSKLDYNAVLCGCRVYGTGTLSYL